MKETIKTIAIGLLALAIGFIITMNFWNAVMADHKLPAQNVAVTDEAPSLARERADAKFNRDVIENARRNVADHSGP